MGTPLQVTSSYDDLPPSNPERREGLLELFGQHLFWDRNERLAAARRLLTDEERRKRLGSIQRWPYDAVASLGQEAIEASLALTKATVDQYMQLVLALFTHKGPDLRFGPRHSLRYRLILEIIDPETLEVVEEEVINSNVQKSLPDYFGRWLNRYGQTSESAQPPNAQGSS